MKERLPPKDPKIRWHRAFSICFYINRLEIDMISMRFKTVYTISIGMHLSVEVLINATVVLGTFLKKDNVPI